MDAVHARIRDKGVNKVAMAEVLYEIAVENDVYMDICHSRIEGSEKSSAVDAFDTLMNESYSDEEEIVHLTNTFENLISQDNSETPPQQDHTGENEVDFLITNVSLVDNSIEDTAPSNNATSTKPTSVPMRISGRRYRRSSKPRSSDLSHLNVFQVPVNVASLNMASRRSEPPTKFYRALMDIGAQKSVIDIPQA